MQTKNLFLFQICVVKQIILRLLANIKDMYMTVHDD